jgi:hypothetical protein
MHAHPTPEGSPLKPAAAAPAIAQWLEWEASALRPATYQGGDPLAAALAELAAAAGKGFLAGGAAVSLADVSGSGGRSVQRRQRCIFAVREQPAGVATNQKNLPCMHITLTTRPSQVAAFCSLLPLQRSGGLSAAPPAVAAYLSKVEAALPLAAALDTVLAGQPADVLAAAFSADAAAYAAAAPKRPVAGRRNVLVRPSLASHT